MEVLSATQMRERIGEETRLSDWIVISQEMIDRFADLTDDHQFIHTDPQRAAKTPFGGTIAHGLLMLSMLSMLSKMVVGSNRYALQGVKMGVNYGFDKVRLVSPVHAGKRVRGRFVLKGLNERGPGQWLVTNGVTVEVEGQDKHVLVADWLSLLFTE